MKSYLNTAWNNAVTYLVTQHKDAELGSGSGFFWQSGERTFLISNWHNFSGRDPATSQPLKADGGLPDRVSFTVFKILSEPDAHGFVEITSVVLTKEICGTTWENPIWLEHPVLRREVDVAALDITDDLLGHKLEVKYANLLENDAAVQQYASQDVFIVGYPLGLVATAPIPVWKRGTIATDPTYDPDGLPKIFVDSATREGMSGSVVIARHLSFGPYKRLNGTVHNVVMAQIDRILGIYSGRIGPHDVKAQLGIVWKRHLIDEGVAGGTVAVV